MKFFALFFRSRSLIVSKIRPVSWTKYFTIFLLGSAMRAFSEFKKSKKIVGLIFESILFEISAIKA